MLNRKEENQRKGKNSIILAFKRIIIFVTKLFEPELIKRRNKETTKLFI